MTTPKETIRLAAVGDIHCTRRSQGALEGVFAQIAQVADVLLLCGDLTDYGLPEEARILARELSPAARIPIVGVLGNHDYESGKADEVCRILSDVGLLMLDGTTCEFHGVGFAGVKGFAGGFGKAMLQSWGEGPIKAFVHEAVEEVLKLESALAKLRTAHRVALLHYSPIEATVVGERRELFPFLGTSRFEDCLNQHSVTLVFHGHAHQGSLEGRTSAGIPVYNVAMPLLLRTSGAKLAFRLTDLTIGGDDSEENDESVEPQD